MIKVILSFIVGFLVVALAFYLGGLDFMERGVNLAFAYLFSLWGGAVGIGVYSYTK